LRRRDNCFVTHKIISGLMGFHGVKDYGILVRKSRGKVLFFRDVTSCLIVLQKDANPYIEPPCTYCQISLYAIYCEL